ncbi:hypothetical protein ACWET9_06700 [Streptomyces sp. NPDC004059]
MTDDSDLDAALARLPQPSLADILRAQREAETTPPPATTIPQPDFTLGGVVRFHCPLDCGWHHDENTDPGPVGSLLLPADFTGDDLSAAITSAAEVRSNNFRLRVEQAISDHFNAAHPGR